MTEAAYYLVGEVRRSNQLLHYASVLAGGVFAVGFVLSELNYPAGDVVQLLGALLGIPLMLYTAYIDLAKIPERNILATLVQFQADAIVVGEQRIELSSVKVIEVTLVHKGQGGSADGTGNSLRLVQRDQRETTVGFYLTTPGQVKKVEELLRAARQRYGLLLIM